ncbi:porin family protein|uniref:porin family protein n=1 Tax=Noviherbaspirillum sp. L7-7A TaxID=2850560 RepID=UPI001C2BAE73|nr:porin family protein [Noviherbaspirillum sp. L7-7A]MBV0878807.1 porin family protein [Noviherbaspirillum sp. L7-7A]
MNKTFIAAMLASAFLFSASAHAAGAYLGANIGSAQHKLSIDGESGKERKTAVKLYGGYAFDENFGIEAGYVRLGKISDSDTDGFNTVSLNYRARALYVAGTAALPLSPEFSVFAKAGITGNNGKVTARFNGMSESMSRTNTTAMFGVGAEYSFAKNMSVVAEYENFGKVIDENDGNTKAQMVSVGLRYKF